MTIPVVWYLAHCVGRMERLTADALERKGFEAYAPMTTVEISHARQKQIVARPLIPRYLFVGLDKDRPAFAEVRKTIGVQWLVSNVIQGVLAPVEVPCPVLDALRSREDAGEFDTTRPKVCAFKPGEKVIIAEDRYDSFVAEILSISGDERAELLLRGLRTNFRVKAPLAKLTKISARPLA